jgi:hypothetical protein
MTCLNCEKEISEKRKFCCLSCSATYNNRRKIKKIKKNNCLNCEKEIIGGNIFCNQSCSAQYNNKKRGIKKCCVNCNKILDRSNKKYCNHVCQHEYLYKKHIIDWKNDKNTIKTITTPIRRYIFEKYNYKCSNVQNNTCYWMGTLINIYSKKSILQIEHIDGNSENNNEENLTLLCPCCHTLTPTYGGLNMGNGRKERRDRYRKGIYKNGLN